MESTDVYASLHYPRLNRVPGRKSDVRDSDWLAQLLEWWLLKSSPVPPRRYAS
jgi:hypothetical protein